MFSGVDQVVLLWDISNGELVGELKGHTDTIYSLAFSREGTILASGKSTVSINETINLYLLIQDCLYLLWILEGYPTPKRQCYVRPSEIMEIFVDTPPSSVSNGFDAFTVFCGVYQLDLVCDCDVGASDNAVKLWDISRLLEDQDDKGTTPSNP